MFFKKKKKKRKNKTKNIFLTPRVEKDYFSTKSVIINPKKPITDPFLLHMIEEATKPLYLPEQRVFNSVEEMMESL